jgi:DNA-binding transcriptional LysR family regulator
MDLSRLRHFVAVAEELHFRKAAERLYITQSALSRQITALERELGIDLFARTRHHVQITEAGRVFLVEAQRILEHADEAMRRARASGNGEAGTMTVGVVESALTEVALSVLRRFQEEHPGVELRSSEETSRSAAEGVLARRLYAAFVPLPIGDDDGPQAYTILKIVNEPMRLAIPASHPLATADAIQLADLDREDLVLISRRSEPALHDYHVSVCTTAGFNPRIRSEVSSTSVGLGYVAAGFGIAFVPPSCRVVSESVVVREIEGPAPEFRIGLMLHAGCAPPTLMQFLDVCAKTLSVEGDEHELDIAACGPHHQHAVN